MLLYRIGWIVALLAAAAGFTGSAFREDGLLLTLGVAMLFCAAILFFLDRQGL
jgi:hypothetical protein